MAAIRFIVHTVSSERDRNGNCYHFAVIVSTKTGKSISLIHVGGPSNARYCIEQCLGERLTYPAIHEIQETIPKREFQRRQRFAASGRSRLVRMEHELTAADFATIETP